MSDKKLTLLGVLAIGLLVLALIVAQVSQVKPEPFLSGAPLLQGIDPAKVDKITFGVGEKLSALKRSGDHFVVQDKGDYPASNQQINELFTKCLDVKVSEKVTDKADNHESLEVTESKARYVIQFYDAQGNLMTGLIVGATAQGIRGTYVRKANDNAVYLSSDTPFFRTAALDYVQKNLCQVDSNKIVEVTVTTPADSYTIIEKEGKPALKEIAADAKPKEYEIRSVFQALASLDFSDVVVGDAASQVKFDSSYVCKLNDSTIYTFQIAKQGEDIFVKASSEFTDTVPVSIDRTKQDSEEELKAKEAKLMARDASKKFNETHGPWLYKLAGWQGGKLVKPYADLIEAPQQEEKPADAPATDAAPVAPSVSEAVPAAPAAPEAAPAPAPAGK